MNMDEEILSDFSDSEISEAKHKNLVDTIGTLDKKSRLKPASRKEPSIQISEYHLVNKNESEKGKKKIVDVNSLVKSLKNKPNNIHIAKKITTVRQSNREETLPKPLEKIHSDKIEREVAFENVKEDLSKWDPIIYDNRIADQLSFPLKKIDVDVNDDEFGKEKSHHDFLNSFNRPNDLELALAKVLDSSKVVTQYREEKERREQEYLEKREKNKKGEFTLTLKEMRDKQREYSKLRAQKAFKEKKAWMQNKIKSKKYHRILKRERVKEKLKEFEKLQKTDPEAALQQLELLDKTRAEERITLRHKSTGQWAKNLAVRAKYDKDSRIALAEQLSQSKALTQKVKRDESSDEDDDSGVEQDVMGGDDGNPWLKNVDQTNVDSYLSGYKKYWEDKNAASEITKQVPKYGEVSFEKLAGTFDDLDDDIDVPIYIEPKNKDKGLVKTNEAPSTINEPVHKETQRENGTTRIKRKRKNTNQNSNENVNDVEEVKLTVNKKETKKLLKNRKMSNNNNNGDAQKIMNESGNWVVEAIEDNNIENDSKKNNKKLKIDNKKINNETTQMENEVTIKSNKKKRNKRKQNKNQLESNEKMNTDESVKLDFSSETAIEEVFISVENKIKEKVKNKLNKAKKTVTGTIEIKKGNKRLIKENRNDSKAEVYSFNDRVKTKKTIDLDVKLDENHDNNEKMNMEDDIKKICEVSKEVTPKQPEENRNPELDQIDPNEFLKVDKNTKMLSRKLPQMNYDDALDDDENDNFGSGDDEDGENTQEMTIEEAFAEDDVVQQFRAEKDGEKKKDEGETIDLSLPGWGSWGGVGVPEKKNKRKKRRFIIKTKPIPRKDQNKPIVIINEERSEDLKKHLVDQIPYPFKSVKEYEASLRTPIGREWVPEIAHRKLIEPSIKTKLGAVIEPIHFESQIKSTLKQYK